MSSEVIAILDDLSRRLGVAIDWSAENVLPYVEDLIGRLVRYETGISIILMVVSVAVAATLIAISLRTWRRVRPSSYSDKEDAMFITGVIVIIVVACFVVFTKQAIDLVTCATFPEKIILAYLQEFNIL